MIPMRKTILLASVLMALILLIAAHGAQSSSLRFEVTVAPGLVSSPQSGRLLVVVSARNQPEPRLTVGATGLNASPVFARDIANFSTGTTGVIDEKCVAFPIESLAKLPVGDYYVQALFDSNIDLKSSNAPGNLYSDLKQIHLDPARGSESKLMLTHKTDDEQLLPETE